ncbi:MAG: hypothetical protein P8Y70_18200 [Candidatus Lokiarchaeota archaeon]
MSSHSEVNNEKEINIHPERLKFPDIRLEVPHFILPFTYIPSQIYKAPQLDIDKNRQEFKRILKKELKKFYYMI